MLRQFLGQALRLGQAKGPSAASRTGKGAERCGHMFNLKLKNHVLLVWKCRADVA